MYLVFRYLKFIIALFIIWAGLFTWSTYGCHRVNGNHMTPTFLDSEYKLFYKQQSRINSFDYGDMAVFYRYYQSRRGVTRYHHIGRVIGLPGDRVEYEGGQLIRNGEKVPENYINDKGKLTTPEIIIPKNTLYVLSDNRTVQTRDSRSFGPIPEYLILGKVSK